MEQSLIPFKKILKSSKKTTVFMILALIGILFIAFGDLSGGEDVSNTAVKKQSDYEYCQELEGKIRTLVTAITGNDSCVVAVTLENSGEYIYADQNKLDLNQTEDKATNGTTTKKEQKSEQEYIIVEGKDGDQTALIVTEKKPGIRGVAIVASGINNMNYDLISSCISSMLGIPSRKISISEAG
ncbi:MAG: hypothetical protein E7551_06350 [Ruminococcaceae bacterium]|nr:hypothetical protein [Oscillospiraceae bacterium]